MSHNPGPVAQSAPSRPRRLARRAVDEANEAALSKKHDAPPPRIAAIILAAGRSSRMGANKLTLPLEGKPVLRHVVDAARTSGAAPILVVLGHEAEKIATLLEGASVSLVFNEDFHQGLSTSLKHGVAALPADVDGALIFLGDMPDVSANLAQRMIAAFNPREPRGVVVPKRNGRQGHPVLWGRGFFAILLEKLSGDVGAKHLIREYAASVAEVDADDDGVFTDLDTPEDFSARKSRNGAA